MSSLQGYKFTKSGVILAPDFVNLVSTAGPRLPSLFWVVKKKLTQPKPFYPNLNEP